MLLWIAYILDYRRSFYEHRATKNFCQTAPVILDGFYPKANYPTLEEDIKVDVAIIEGYHRYRHFLHACKAGVKVAVIEADRILQGTTGHTTAKITSQHDLIYSKIYSQMGRNWHSNMPMQTNLPFG